MKQSKCGCCKKNQVVNKLPKTADGYPIYPGMYVWYMGSEDSFAGPHKRKVSGVFEERCDVELCDGVVNTSTDSVYYLKSNIKDSQ